MGQRAEMMPHRGSALDKAIFNKGQLLAYLVCIIGVVVYGLAWSKTTFNPID